MCLTTLQLRPSRSLASPAGQSDTAGVCDTAQARLTAQCGAPMSMRAPGGAYCVPKRAARCAFFCSSSGASAGPYSGALKSVWKRAARCRMRATSS